MAGGNTALDAIRMAVGEMRRASNPRKALLLVSDGVENRSRYTARDIRRLISEVDFPVYTINVYERPRGNRYGIQRRDSGILEIISATTGGRTFAVRDPRKLMSVAELINSEIRHEYVLGYVPSNQALDGKFHRIHVEIGPSSGPVPDFP
ncbi:MAG: Ca-activated chloride channel [Hyphomicrobiales bacterium]|nr:Ca-activated chloride channel [Hyphomicrobiales bacterium]